MRSSQSQIWFGSPRKDLDQFEIRLEFILNYFSAQTRYLHNLAAIVSQHLHHSDEPIHNHSKLKPCCIVFYV